MGYPEVSHRSFPTPGWPIRFERWSSSLSDPNNGEAGAGKDTFFISVTGPNFSYSNGGFITEGNVQIHKE
jgi:hypothetical protein